MNKTIKAIVDFLEEARKKYNIPKEKLEQNGAVFYCNGNDGTDFDWNWNNRLCEFGYGVEDGSRWAFKMLVNTNGSATIYCYPNGEMEPVEKMKRVIGTTMELYELYELMMTEADDKMKWDCTLEELGLIA